MKLAVFNTPPGLTTGCAFSGIESANATAIMYLIANLLARKFLGSGQQQMTLNPEFPLWPSCHGQSMRIPGGGATVVVLLSLRLFPVRKLGLQRSLLRLRVFRPTVDDLSVRPRDDRPIDLA